MSENHTRVFFVVDVPEAVDIPEELYTELEPAADECDELEKLHHTPRLRVCLVRHSYYDEELRAWNYEDYADTFTAIKTIEDWRLYL